MTASDAKPDMPEDPLAAQALPTSSNRGQPGASSEPSFSASIGEGLFPKIIKFDSLARCGEEIWIENNGQIYRLRRTRQGKLILTK